MKKLDRKAIAVVFEANPGYRTLFFTADGQSFLTENYAKQYAKEAKLEDQAVIPLDKDVEFLDTEGEGKEGKPISAADLIGQIAAIASVEEYDAFELPEGEKRATVVKALTDKRTELGIV